MADTLEKARKGTEATARGTAATARAVIPILVIAVLILAGTVPMFVVAQIVEGEPETDEQFIAFTLMMGLGIVATAIAWGCAAIATALHFAGRHLGRNPPPDKTD